MYEVRGNKISVIFQEPMTSLNPLRRIGSQIAEVITLHRGLDKKAAKVIMTTALNEERNVKKAFEMGCTVYCAKPIDLDKLTKALEKLELI